jgi:hypothetical protein
MEASKVGTVAGAVEKGCVNGSESDERSSLGDDGHAVMPNLAAICAPAADSM